MDVANENADGHATLCLLPDSKESFNKVVSQLNSLEHAMAGLSQPTLHPGELMHLSRSRTNVFARFTKNVYLRSGDGAIVIFSLSDFIGSGDLSQTVVKRFHDYSLCRSTLRIEQMKPLDLGFRNWAPLNPVFLDKEKLKDMIRSRALGVVEYSPKLPYSSVFADPAYTTETEKEPSRKYLDTSDQDTKWWGYYIHSNVSVALRVNVTVVVTLSGNKEGKRE